MDVVEHGQWVGKNLCGSDDAIDTLRPSPWSYPRVSLDSSPSGLVLVLVFSQCASSFKIVVIPS